MSELWRLQAACRDADPEAMFATGPEAGRFVSDFCVGCEVRDECRDADPDGDELGVYGGLTQRERQSRARRKRPNPKLAPCGTEAAYQRHVRHRESACGPCREEHDRHNAARVRRSKRSPKTAKPPPKQTGACGTTPGYRRHRALGQETCPPCREAWTAYTTERRKAREAA